VLAYSVIRDQATDHWIDAPILGSRAIEDGGNAELTAIPVGIMIAGITAPLAILGALSGAFVLFCRRSPKETEIPAEMETEPEIGNGSAMGRLSDWIDPDNSLWEQEVDDPSDEIFQDFAEAIG
jgi:hypothetical protein